MSVQTNTTENQAQTEQPKDNRELNFDKMRKQLDQERAEKAQYQQRLAELEKERTRQNSQREDDEDSNEPYVDHKFLNKKMAKWEENIEQKIEKKAEEKARQLVEEERRNNYLKENNDFNEVMQPEVIQKFADKHPRVAEKILRMPDGFERQQLVYETIKAMGINKKEEPKQSIQQTIDQNRRSPFYQPSGVGSAPYAAAGDFSDAGKKNAYSKLQELKSKLRI